MDMYVFFFAFIYFLCSKSNDDDPIKSDLI